MRLWLRQPGSRASAPSVFQNSKPPKHRGAVQDELVFGTNVTSPTEESGEGEGSRWRLRVIRVSPASGKVWSADFGSIERQ
ncbi:hypothetical protein IRJ41_003527 [Triplophysa rosa]|uniref:Uncharacterized protein n=1 Tax=Triplophysa rosa TaxID=992332 RepID=A0A9W7TTQ1_TRIRA|nr:hypothetical protein IRJ41_003527 [Triplophysa rosa]